MFQRLAYYAGLESADVGEDVRQLGHTFIYQSGENENRRNAVTTCTVKLLAGLPAGATPCRN
jgi:hypothetical protein